MTLYKDEVPFINDINKLPTVTETQLYFTDYIKVYGAGEYTFMVHSRLTAAYGEESAISGMYSYSEPATLKIPTNLRCDDMVAKWDTVEYARSYSLCLYKNGDYVANYGGFGTDIMLGRCDFSSKILENGEGEYSFEVCATVLAKTYKFSEMSVGYTYINSEIEVEGDVNNDGVADIRDLVRLKKITAELAEDVNGTADLHKDGRIDALDVTEMKNLLLGK